MIFGLQGQDLGRKGPLSVLRRFEKFCIIVLIWKFFQTPHTGDGMHFQRVVVAY